jgi:hydroxyacylglutathione hydrolase
MILRQFLYAQTACASYVFGCTTHRTLGVLDPHVELVDRYLEAAAAADSTIVAVFETHVQADHVSGLPEVVAATGATAYLPAGAQVGFEHHPLADGERVELGNTIVTALATPGHAPAHHTYLVADRRRQTDDPWLAFTGDSMLVNDAGRPDLHAGGGDPRALALAQHASMQRLLELPDYVVVLPSHYGGSVCGRGLSGNPLSSIGFERLHNRALLHTDAKEFADELLRDIPEAPSDQARIVAANRRGAAVPAPAGDQRI